MSFSRHMYYKTAWYHIIVKMMMTKRYPTLLTLPMYVIRSYILRTYGQCLVPDCLDKQGMSVYHIKVKVNNEVSLQHTPQYESTPPPPHSEEGAWLKCGAPSYLPTPLAWSPGPIGIQCAIQCSTVRVWSR